MDPDAALDTIRELCSRGSANMNGRQVHALIELVEALDDWLTTGGFLPVVWAMGLAARAEVLTPPWMSVTEQD